MGRGRRRSSGCAVTRFSTSLRAPLRERFCPCTHGSPRCPPHADARNWDRHRSLPSPPLPSGARTGLGVATQACAEEAGGEAVKRVAKSGAPACRCRLAPLETGEAGEREGDKWICQKRGKSSVVQGRQSVDCLAASTHPHPLRRRGSDLQNSGLFFSSAMVRKNAACVSSFPPATAPHSPPLAPQPPPPLPPPSPKGGNTHRAGHRRSAQNVGLVSVVSAPWTLVKRLISPVASLPPPGSIQSRRQPAHKRKNTMISRSGTRWPVAGRANSLGVRKCVTIGLFTMLYTIRSCWALGSTREKSSSRRNGAI